MEKNSIKYPVDKVYGSSKKYDEYWLIFYHLFNNEIQKKIYKKMHVGNYDDIDDYKYDYSSNINYIELF